MLHQMKPLPCDPTGIEGMSERLIRSHYENNYGGTVQWAPSTCAAEVEAIRAAWAERIDSYAKAAAPVTSAQV